MASYALQLVFRNILISMSIYFSSTANDSKERRFWSCVRPETVQRILEMYRVDLQIFDYDYNNYFRKLGFYYKIADF